jgi:hypothetical protein
MKDIELGKRRALGSAGALGDEMRRVKMGRARSIAAAGILIVLVGALPAHAGKPAPTSSACPATPTDLCTDYVIRDLRWATRTIPYYINPQDAPVGAIEDVQDSFLTWQNELKSPQVEAAFPGDRSSISFVYMGLTTAVQDTHDGINVVVFPRCSQCGASFVSRASRRSTISEFEIVVNATYQWQTDLSCPTHDCGAYDLQGIVTHEVGHVLDLYHPGDARASALTMYPGGVPNDMSKRDLGAGDILGLRKAYPL